ncbi:MAG: PilZ domain-containing protein [Nitrospiria bacterium]
MKKKGFDEREYTRIPMKVDVEMEEISTGEKRIGKTNIVSMKGFFIECDNPFPPGTECHITLLIGGAESRLHVRVRAKIVYITDEGMGVQVISHLSMESYEHLHRLVLYNAADAADTVEQEIEDHLQKKTD